MDRFSVGLRAQREASNQGGHNSDGPRKVAHLRQLPWPWLRAVSSGVIIGPSRFAAQLLAGKTDANDKAPLHSRSLPTVATRQPPQAAYDDAGRRTFPPRSNRCPPRRIAGRTRPPERACRSAAERLPPHTRGRPVGEPGCRLTCRCSSALAAWVPLSLTLAGSRQPFRTVTRARPGAQTCQWPAAVASPPEC